jgi:hypothetical protein
MLQTGQEQNWSKSSLTPELAATELIKRLDATEQLMEFTRYTFRKYQVNSHHKTIASQLERVERGEIDRLMLLVPPRHGKSELASKRSPAWYLGRRPDRQFLAYLLLLNWHQTSAVRCAISSAHHSTRVCSTRS